MTRRRQTLPPYLPELGAAVDLVYGGKVVDGRFIPGRVQVPGEVVAVGKAGFWIRVWPDWFSGPERYYIRYRVAACQWYVVGSGSLKVVMRCGVSQ